MEGGGGEGGRERVKGKGWSGRERKKKGRDRKGWVGGKERGREGLRGTEKEGD